MPFKKGSCANPGGRPRTLGLVQSLAKQHTAEAIEKLVKIMRYDDPDTATAQIAAAKAILDRGWGTPYQSIELTGEGGGPLRVVSGEPLTQEQWAAKYAIGDSLGTAAGTTESTD